MAQINITEDWRSPAGAVPAPLPISFGSYDYNGLVTFFRTQRMDPRAVLDKLRDDAALTLGGMPDLSGNITRRLRIVVPDHDRLRLVLPPGVAPVACAIDYNAELKRLELYIGAYAVIDSHAFASAELVEQNDTDSPDAAGADDLLWFRVWSLAPGKLGPWAGRWEFKRSGSPIASYVDPDPGTPPGAPRLVAFVRTVRDAALHLDGTRTTRNDGLHRSVAMAGLTGGAPPRRD